MSPYKSLVATASLAFGLCQDISISQCSRSNSSLPKISSRKSIVAKVSPRDFNFVVVSTNLNQRVDEGLSTRRRTSINTTTKNGTNIGFSAPTDKASRLPIPSGWIFLHTYQEESKRNVRIFPTKNLCTQAEQVSNGRGLPEILPDERQAAQR